MRLLRPERIAAPDDERAQRAVIRLVFGVNVDRAASGAGFGHHAVLAVKDILDADFAVAAVHPVHFQHGVAGIVVRIAVFGFDAANFIAGAAAAVAKLFPVTDDSDNDQCGQNGDQDDIRHRIISLPSKSNKQNFVYLT